MTSFMEFGKSGNRHQAENSDGLKIRLLVDCTRGSKGDVITLSASVARELLNFGKSELAE